MFDREATRLTRIDWMKYGLSALNPSSGQEPTNEQLKQAILGMATGFNQFAQELSQLIGGHDIPVKHRAPVALIGYEPDAPGINDDTAIEDTYPRIMSWSGDSYYDPTDGYAKGGLAGLFQGVVVMRPNVNNVNVNVGGAQHNIVLWGQNGAGARFENLFITNLYNEDGTAFSGLGALPIGSVIQWAGAIGSIPTGWALMDGTANASGSGIDMRGQVGYGYSGAGDFATIGGTISITLTATLLGNGGSTAVSIDGHSGAGSTNTGTQALAFDPTPISEDFQSGASFTLYAFDESPVISPDPHSHTMSGSAIAALIGNHSATVSNNTLAGNITIDTPTVLRPAGKVLAWIERIS